MGILIKRQQKKANLDKTANYNKKEKRIKQSDTKKKQSPNKKLKNNIHINQSIIQNNQTEQKRLKMYKIIIKERIKILQTRGKKKNKSRRNYNINQGKKKRLN